MRNRPSRLAGQSPERKVLGDECQARIANLAGLMKRYVTQCFLAFRERTFGTAPGKRGAAQRTFPGNEFRRSEIGVACGNPLAG